MVHAPAWWIAAFAALAATVLYFRFLVIFILIYQFVTKSHPVRPKLESEFVESPGGDVISKGHFEC